MLEMVNPEAKSWAKRMEDAMRYQEDTGFPLGPVGFTSEDRAMSRPFHTCAVGELVGFGPKYGKADETWLGQIVRVQYENDEFNELIKNVPHSIRMMGGLFMRLVHDDQPYHAQELYTCMYRAYSEFLIREGRMEELANLPSPR